MAYDENRTATTATPACFQGPVPTARGWLALLYEHADPQVVVVARHRQAPESRLVWHVDLAAVPTAAGLWASWLPFALPQCWPFCWWLAVVLDHYSRRALGFTLFKGQPTSQQVRQFLGRLMAGVEAAPKYLVTDSGPQFACRAFTAWCRRHDIRQRRGAVGKRGSIAVVERWIRTLKESCTRLLTVVPLLRRSFQRDSSASGTTASAPT